MATKAQEFKSRTQRTANPPKPKSAKRAPRNVGVDTSLPGVSATDRKVGAKSTAKRNASIRAGKKGGVVLEDSASGTPSRKSTRRTTGRVKTTNAMERLEIRKTGAPKARATKAKTVSKKLVVAKAKTKSRSR